MHAHYKTFRKPNKYKSKKKKKHLGWHQRVASGGFTVISISTPKLTANTYAI